MGMRAKRKRSYEEEPMQLEEVLEPYDQQQAYAQQFPYDDQVAYEEESAGPMYQQAAYQPYPETGYADYLPEDEHYEGDEAADTEVRFGMAAHVFDVVSSLVGVFVILLLVALLLMLVDWLRTDILHSFMMLQSGIS